MVHAHCTRIMAYWDCMSSVRLSVTLVDQGHIGWKSWKLIARTISPTPSLFDRNPKGHPPYSIGLLQGEHEGILGRLEMGGKVTCWSTKVAISLKRVKIDEKLLWRAYRNSPTLFRTMPSPPSYTVSPSPRLGVCNPTPKLQSHRVHPNKTHLKCVRKGSVGVSRNCPNFWSTPISY